MSNPSLILKPRSRCEARVRFAMNRTYRGGSVTPDPSLFTAVMEGQWEIVREKVSP